MRPQLSDPSTPAALGFLAMPGACYLLIDNRAGLSGAGDATYVEHRQIGRFVREEDVESGEERA